MTYTSETGIHDALLISPPKLELSNPAPRSLIITHPDAQDKTLEASWIFLYLTPQEELVLLLNYSPNFCFLLITSE